MRVLILNPILYTAENDNIPKVKSIKDTMIYSLCLAFVKCGHEPVLVAANTYQPVQDEDYPFEIIWLECLMIKICKPRYLPMLKGLGKYLRKNKQYFDYIVSSEVFSLTSFQSVLWANEKLIIWHELGAHQKLMKRIPSKLWYNIIARTFMRHTLITPRSKRASDFISAYCRNVSSVIIDHGVDIEKINYCTEKEDFFVVVSQLIKRKNIESIIHKFEVFIKKSGLSYQLKIIGDGELRDELKDEATRLGLDGKVIFCGKLTHHEMMPILSKAKALLVNTQKDNSMVSIVESIASGTPILTNSIPFNSDYISKEKLGVVDDDWGTIELNEIIQNSNFYISNCIIYREKLCTEYSVNQFNHLYTQMQRLDV